MKSFLASGTIATALALLSAAPAGAQTREQKADARAAAEAGGDAFDAGKWSEAADLFERAERLMHAPPHLLFAARAHAKLGHLVQARELYLTLTREHLDDHAPKAFKDAQQMGERELPDIESRLPYVSLVVQGAGKAPFRVTRNGEDVPLEVLGVPAPINPGDYSFQAFADGMESTATTVKVTDGARETVLLTLRAVPGGARASSSSSSQPGVRSGAASLSTSDSSTQPADRPSSGGRPLLIGSIASFAVGAAGLGLGSVFLVKRTDTNNRADELYKCYDVNDPSHLGMRVCGDPEDPTSKAAIIKGLESDVRTQTAVAVTGFVIGGLGIAGGITLLVMDGNRDKSSGATQITPVVGLNYAGVAGTF